MTSLPPAEVDRLFTGFTRLCKGLSVVLAVGCAVVNVVPSSLNYLALIPAKTIPFAWNLITAGYIEKSVIGVVISIIGLLFFGKLLEPVWGSKEFLKFIIVVNFLTSVCTFISAIALYCITKKENFLYEPLSGFHGVLMGFLVGIKQLVPDQELSLLSLLSIKAKWLPSLVLLLSIALSFFVADSASFLPIVIFGTYTSWIYLRYFQKKLDANDWGDRSHEFAFSTFFPEVLQPFIDPIASLLDNMLCRIAVSTKQAKGQTLGDIPLGFDPIEASRRRERGARALEERLAAQRSAAQSPEETAQKDGPDIV